MTKRVTKLFFFFIILLFGCKNDNVNEVESIESFCDFIAPPPPPFKGDILVDENYIIDSTIVDVRIIADRLTKNLTHEQQSYIVSIGANKTYDTFSFLLPFENTPFWNEIRTEYSPEEKTIYIGFNEENEIYRLYKINKGSGYNKNSIYFNALYEKELSQDIEKTIKTDKRFIKYSKSKRYEKDSQPKIWKKGVVKFNKEYYDEICIGEFQNLSQKVEYEVYINRKTNKLVNELK